jgi:hypothetical protein
VLFDSGIRSGADALDRAGARRGRRPRRPALRLRAWRSPGRPASRRCSGT